MAELLKCQKQMNHYPKVEAEDEKRCLACKDAKTCVFWNMHQTIDVHLREIASEGILLGLSL